MEGIYQNSLYSSQQLPYVLPPATNTTNTNTADGQHPYSHYGNQQQQQYRSSAFSDARSSPPPSTSYHHHSAGLNAASSNNYSSHGGSDINHHHHHHHDNNTHNTNTNTNNTTDTYNHHHHTNNNNNWASNSPNLSWNSSPPPPLPPPSRNNSFGGYSNTLPHMSAPMQRPKLTTTVWEDEGTLCYQVDAKSVCVARRQDNDMINGTKLLNVVGMSRGKRDGILKNEKGRVVVKVGAMHLKGVWITFNRAKDLANKFKITEILYPLFVEDPSIFLSVPPPPAATTGSNSNNGLPIMLPSSNNTSTSRGSYYNNKNETASFGSFNFQSWEKQSYQSLPSITNGQQQQDQMIIRSQHHNHNNIQQQQQQQQQQNSGSCSPVPGSITQPSILSNEENDLYLLNNPYEYRNGNRYNHSSNNTTTTTNTSHPYSLYSTADNHHTSEGQHQFSSPYDNNNSSPYMHSTTSRKHSISTETKDEDKHSIDFPSSPPPESSSNLKYETTNNSTSWSDSINSVNRKTPLGSSSSSIRTAGLVMVSGCHPLSNEIDDTKSLNKGRKRGHQQEKSTSSLPMIQRKRMKNNDNTISSP